MDFYGIQVLALADPRGAEAIFTPARTDPVLRAAYEFRNVEVSSVDVVEARQTTTLGMSPATLDAELTLWAPGESAAWTGQVTARSHAAAPSFDAEVRLRIMTSTRTALTTVTDVRTTDTTTAFKMAEVDARILAEDGALPVDAESLEIRRRNALLAVLLDRFEQPEDWDPDTFWRDQGSASTAEVIERYGAPSATLAAALDLVVTPDSVPRTLHFTFDLSVLVLEDPFADLRATFDRIRSARGAQAASATHPEPVAGAMLRTPVPVAVVCATDAFEDADLPMPIGSNPADDLERREARLQALNSRLATAGVAFVPV